jgi:hypothetical protein
METVNHLDLTLRQQLVSVASLYAQAKGLSRSRVSTLVFSGGMVLDRLSSEAADITTVNFEKAMGWFSANWPADTPWPEGIVRPSAVPAAETEA